MSEPIRFHHVPEKATAVVEHVAVVSIAEVMAGAQGTSLEENAGLFTSHRASLELLGIDDEIAEAMLEEYLVHRNNAVRDAFSE